MKKNKNHGFIGESDMRTKQHGFEIRKIGKQVGLIVLAASFFISGCEGLKPYLKKDRGIGQEKQAMKRTGLNTTDVAVIVFDTATRHLIRKYYRNHPELVYPGTTVSTSSVTSKGKGKGKGKGRKKGPPPGLAKKKQLPPGLAKKDKLPPGLQKRGFPGDLERKLQPPHPDTERVVVDDKVLLIQRSTQLVLDIIDLANK